MVSPLILSSRCSSAGKDASPMPMLDASGLSTPRKLLDSSQFGTPGTCSGEVLGARSDKRGRGERCREEMGKMQKKNGEDDCDLIWLAVKDCIHCRGTEKQIAHATKILLLVSLDNAKYVDFVLQSHLDCADVHSDNEVISITLASAITPICMSLWACTADPSH